jgi:hypothetical protein
MQRTIAFILFTLAALQVDAAQAKSEVLSSGLCERRKVSTVYAQPQSTAGYATAGDLIIKKQTEIVPLRKGIGFGFTWRASELPKRVDVKCVVEHPPIIRPDGMRLESNAELMTHVSSDGVVETTDCYILEEDHELVPGNWSISIVYEGAILDKQTYRVVREPSAADIDETLLKIERIVALGGRTEPSLGESIADGIERNPAQLSQALVLKLNDKKLTEQQLAVYVWALGLTRDQAAVDVIAALYRQSKSVWVRATCLRALASICGQQAGELLLAVLDTTTDQESRWGVLNLLSQMQYEMALPKAGEVLSEDPEADYWRPIFVFGKMGNKAVPFLLGKINDKNRNIRANAINLVGHWLISTDAAKPLQDQLWAETDVELRRTILSSLEKIIPDFIQMTTVFEQVVAKEKDKEALQFACETLGNMDQLKADITAFAEKKQFSSAAFQAAYTQLFKSAGKKGSYEALAIFSTTQDEPPLNALRERVLIRDSDEAFQDYQRINEIISRNRLTESLKNTRTSNELAGRDAKFRPTNRPGRLNEVCSELLALGQAKAAAESSSTQEFSYDATVIQEGQFKLSFSLHGNAEQVQGTGFMRPGDKYGIEFVKPSGDVTAKLGVSFGFRYRVRGLPAGRTKVFEMRAIHPPMNRPDGSTTTVSTAPTVLLGDGDDCMCYVRLSERTKADEHRAFAEGLRRNAS